MWPVTVRSIDHFTKARVAPRGPGSMPRFRPAMERGYSEGTHSCCQHHLSHCQYTHDTSTSRWVLCVCVCACQRHVPTHCPIFSAHAQMISLISSSVSSHPFLSSFLFFFSLTGSVYDPFLNTSPFPQGGHCHLSRLTTSPTFPLRYLSLFLRPLPRSLIDDISHRHLLGDLYRPFSARPLNGGCVPPFRQSVQLIGGIKLTNCHHIL